MSRIGRMPVKLPKGVKVDIKDGLLKAEGPKGKLSYRIHDQVSIVLKGEELLIGPKEGLDLEIVGKFLGTTRTNVYNIVNGVANGFQKELDIVGVGFRAAIQGSTLNLTIGFSHPVDYKLPEGITAKVDKNTHIVISGADKELVGRVAAKIRSFRKPEPYQGKGIRYTNEHIIRKVGKAATAK